MWLIGVPHGGANAGYEKAYRSGGELVGMSEVLSALNKVSAAAQNRCASRASEAGAAAGPGFKPPQRLTRYVPHYHLVWRCGMSLTSFIDTKEMRAMFRQTFKKPRLPYSREIQAKLLTDNHFLVGTAFDYLVRFFVEFHNKQRVIKDEWIASYAIDYLSTKRQVEKAERMLSFSKEIYERYISTGEFCDTVAESVLLLAQLEEVYRSGTVVDRFGHANK